MDINGKTYEIKKPLTFGQIRKIRGTMGGLMSLSSKLGKSEQELAQLPEKELFALSGEILNRTEEQDEIIVNVFEENLGLTQSEIDKLSYPEAVALFNQVFKESVEPKKKLEQPYA